MSKAKYTTIKGMSDIVPPESGLWNYVETMAREGFAAFGCSEIRTPIAEKTDLFVRSIGDATSVVEKEMYTFLDRNEESMSLRPEATASVVRAYIQGHSGDDRLAKYYYMGPMFRYERPQKGRKRQFHQIGVEVIGSEKPIVDAEVMAMCHTLFVRLGLKDYDLEINSIGCSKCRPGFNEKFQAFLSKKSKHLCKDCLRRIEKNPLRAFDCKVEECKEMMKDAPLICDHLCAECQEHFSGVERSLSALNIPYKVNHRIVRGLDYYVRTAFEFTTTRLGAQNAISAGGRYDGLIESMGGPDVAGVGFSIGVERVMLLIEALGVMPDLRADRIFFAIMGEKSTEKLVPMIQHLRSDGVNVEWDYEGRSLKAQMRLANRLSAHTVVIAGDQEMENGLVVIRNMETREQSEVKIEDLLEHFART